jgi:hypothetical protein
MCAGETSAVCEVFAEWTLDAALCLEKEANASCEVLEVWRLDAALCFLKKTCWLRKCLQHCDLMQQVLREEVFSASGQNR